jgi:hypothetical protein
MNNSLLRLSFVAGERMREIELRTDGCDLVRVDRRGAVAP